MKKTNREKDYAVIGELEAAWHFWLRQAQITNDEDRFTYSHGVFTTEPNV